MNDRIFVNQNHLDALEAIPFFEGQISALAFDYGLKKIGVAYGQSVTCVAKEVTILNARDGIPEWTDIEKIILEWHPNFLVIGLPYNMDGSSGELLARAVTFAHRLNGRFQIPCYGSDERLSSAEARDQRAGEEVLKRKRKSLAVDDTAAKIILEDWFEKLMRQKAINDG